LIGEGAVAHVLSLAVDASQDDNDTAEGTPSQATDADDEADPRRALAKVGLRVWVPCTVS
jgi:hypothetical protein